VGCEVDPADRRAAHRADAPRAARLDRVVEGEAAAHHRVGEQQRGEVLVIEPISNSAPGGRRACAASRAGRRSRPALVDLQRDQADAASRAEMSTAAVGSGRQPVGAAPPGRRGARRTAAGSGDRPGQARRDGLGAVGWRCDRRRLPRNLSASADCGADAAPISPMAPWRGWLR
jgi:hypothetical protein